MVAIKLSATVDENHRLTVNVPENIPPGPVDVIIQTESIEFPQSERELIHAKLARAGILAPAPQIPEDWPTASDEELTHLGKLPPDTPPSETLIDEDRGRW